jgi:hypothetical protein
MRGVFVQICMQIFCKNWLQAVQRPKTRANSGDEITLNDASHPIGIARCGGCAGKVNPSSFGKIAGLTDGKRSPFSARSTNGGLYTPARGKEGNENKLAANSATSTLATRSQNTPRIGSTPQLHA